MYNKFDIYKYTTMLNNYQSDFTKFINKYLEENPEIQKNRSRIVELGGTKKRDFEFEKIKEKQIGPKKPYEYY